MAVTAAQLKVEITADGASQTVGALRSVGQAVDGAKSGFDRFFASVKGGAGDALRALDGFARVMGSIGLVGGITLIAGGAKAAWAQVDAVEQATVALRAYETDARKVDTVLKDLLAFARSDQGKLFMRQELFAAAQNLKVYGAETQNLTRYVEIMSRSVSIGLGTWDELGRVIGRVGSTGKLTGIDFEMLTKMGFQLDSSLRNTTITWEQLFDVLDRGMNKVTGQSETIKGRLMTLSTSIRGVGLAFLEVDTETSKFVEGGLGDRIMKGLEHAPQLLKQVAEGARSLGEAIVGVIDFGRGLVAAFQMLPDGLQSVLSLVLKAVAAFGALRVAMSGLSMAAGMAGLGGILGSVSGMAGTFSAAGGGALGLRAAIGGLLASINPLGIAIGVAVAGVGVLISQWALHRREVQQQQAAVEGLRKTYESLFGTIDQYLVRGGDVTRAGYAEMLNQQLGMVPDIMTRQLEEQNKRNQDAINTMIRNKQPVSREMIDKIYADSTELYTFTAQQVDSLNKAQQTIIEAMLNPNIDGEALFNAINSINTMLTNEVITPDQWLEQILGVATGLSGFTVEANEAEAAAQRMTQANREWAASMDDLRLSGQGSLADDLDSLRNAFSVTGEHSEFFGDSMGRIIDKAKAGEMNIQGLTSHLADLRRAAMEGDITWGEYDEAVFNASVRLSDFKDTAKETTEALEQMFSLMGAGDLASKLNLAGVGNDATWVASGIGQATSALSAMFNVIVGGTNAIDSQVKSVADWIDNLVKAQGEWSDLDDLLDKGLIGPGQHGVFDDGSVYGNAQIARDDIVAAYERIHDLMLAIQVAQAPMIADQVAGVERWAEALHDMAPDKQLETLLWMNDAYQQQATNVMSLVQNMRNMGASGEDIHTALEGIIAANPGLEMILQTMGLISNFSIGEDGSMNFDVNLDGADATLQALQDLTSSIDALTLALGGVPPALDATAASFANFGSSARSAAQALIDMANAPEPGGNDTWGNTGVPVVTGLPNTGTGGTVVFTGDDSALRETVEEISAMVAVVDAMAPTVEIFGDNGSFITTYQDVGAMVATMNGWTSSIDIVANNYFSVVADQLASAYNGRTLAITYIDVVPRMNGIPGRAGGGIVNEPLTLVGEQGPEIVALPRGARVYSHDDSRSIAGMLTKSASAGAAASGGVVIEISGNTFHNTSRDEMNAWAGNDLLPAIKDELQRQRVGQGVA